jgi:tetratricopeptide (TPR) repeat protein
MLRGTVCDSQHHPLAGVDVSLQSATGMHTWKARTDSSGVFIFPSLPEGTYTIRAEAMDKGKATTTIPLAAKETRTIYLTFSDATLAFFDEPTFSVAGVTDTTSLGGHGSDTVVRTRNALSKATASLSKETVPGATAQVPATENSLREAQQRDPESFAANYELAKFLVESGRTSDAKPYLTRASEIETASKPLSDRDRSSLQHLLGDAAERTGDPLAAVHAYQRAAELDPTEANIFDWGAELLLHHAPEPATEVFSNGNQRFPSSVRLLIGLGVAWYARGSYEQAERRLCDAIDLAPNDPVPYLFLGKILGVETGVSEDVAKRVARFAERQPQNAMANYNYAVSLWKQRKGPGNTELIAKVQTLLEHAIALDAKLGAAFFQLGIVHADRKEFQKAIAAYQHAIEVDPRMEEAHYRLAQAYRLSGQADMAQKELELYQTISKEKATEVERERIDIKQFVYTLRGQRSSPQP